MKIRTDYVTNSSSTSFIIILDGEFSENNFLQLAGVDQSSPLCPVFKKLYKIIREKMKEATDITILNGMEELKEKMRLAQESGKKVYSGKLESEDNIFECFFCTDSIEMENEKIYFNAVECVW